VFKQLKNKSKWNIITVTLNPVLDRTVWIEDFKIGKTCLIDKSQILACGKGVNVSRALKNFDVDSNVTGILCSVNKDIYLDILRKENINNDFVLTKGSIRTNITIITNSKDGETHIRDRGSVINSLEIDKIEEKMKSLFKENTIYIFSGSLPMGLKFSTYKRLIKYANNLGAKSFLDTSGYALKEGIKAKPFFIKPNIYEVKEVLGFLPRSDKDFINAACTFYKMGIKNVMISRGKEGIIYYNGDKIKRARVQVLNPINAVGSGDASLAGAIIGITQGRDNEYIARLSCAFGAANTLFSGACIFNKEDVINLFESVKIE